MIKRWEEIDLGEKKNKENKGQVFCPSSGAMGFITCWGSVAGQGAKTQMISTIWVG